MPSLANGILCFGPSLFVSAAFTLSLFSSSLCNFYEVDVSSSNIPIADNVQAIGFWCYEGINGNRSQYPSNLDLDSEFETARALGLTANIIGFIVFLVYLFAGCIPFPAKIFVLTGFLCMMACMFEGFKFWLGRSTTFCDSQITGLTLDCSMDAAAKCSISSAVLWFMAGLMTCAHGKERMAAQERRRDERAEDDGKQRREGDDMDDRA
ncbi:hypothetical protein ACA910_006679 [Epithemia clementina (nom. ined.)]